MKKLMETVVAKVTDQKAECDLILNTSKSLKMSVQNASLSEYKVSSSQILGLRVIKDQKVGISYTESLDEASLDFMISEALQNAQTQSPNSHEKILDLTGELRDEGPSNSEGPVSNDEKVERVLGLETTPRKLDPRVQAVPYNGYSEQEYFSHYLSSRGRYTFESDQSFSIWNSVLLNEGEKKSTFFDFDQARSFRDLQWEKVIKTSLTQAQNLLDARTIATGNYQVMLSPDSLKNLLGVFSGIFSAKGAKDKINPWADKLGTEVASKDIMVEDHPLFPGAFRGTLFDSEGVKRAPLTLIDDGELKSFYHNSSTASYFGVASTGHASRSPSGPLGVSGTMLVIHGKNAKPVPQRRLEIIQVDGLHAGTNWVTGDFSLPVKGYLWENNERIQAVGNVTLSGNFYQMFKNLEVVGSGLVSSTDLSFFTVPLVFNDLSIAGK